jgi:methylthioribose-1-phosphate isomerase
MDDQLTTVQWCDGKVRILDQKQLPEDLVLLEISDYHGIVKAIKELSVRGAPAIGIAAAFGVVLATWYLNEVDRAGFLESTNRAILELKNTRPTAKNLFWSLERMRTALTKNLNKPLKDVKMALLKEAKRIQQDDLDRCKNIGRYGAELLPNRANILTHCNAGALATAGYGTALGLVRAAVEMGKKIHVYAGETRPLLQGARLTTFELMEDGIDVTLICDNMAGYLMQRDVIDAVVVGADRITMNGDVANKIGTYSLAVLAHAHNIPFYVAAPFSTFDPDLKTGEDIPIEKRNGDEVRKIGSQVIAPEQVPVINPAFDVTPNHLINAIVTERGVITPPYVEGIKEKFNVD